MKAVIHIHSCYSYDSYSSPKSIVNYAVKNGIDVLCITDHDTIKGALEAKCFASSKFPDKIKVIIGAEYYTDCGDIIALNIKNEISFNNAFDLIEKVHKEEGTILLPHPYKNHKKLEDLAALSDGIEIFNSRCDETENTKAKELAFKYGKPQYVASDAHFLVNCFDCINYFENKENDSFDRLLKSIQINKSTVKYVKKNKIYLSQSIKGIKTQNFSILKNSLIQYSRFTLKEILS